MELFWDIPTPRYLIAALLTTEMESKLQFMLEQVPKQIGRGYINRYFQKFCTWGSTFPDIIRYICVNIHPTNKTLCSNVIQRWDFIKSIIYSKHYNQAPNSQYQQIKLALFFDWVSFSEPDRIMNIGT